jgi:hypothetical protein
MLEMLGLFRGHYERLLGYTAAAQAMGESCAETLNITAAAVVLSRRTEKTSYCYILSKKAVTAERLSAPRI